MRSSGVAAAGELSAGLNTRSRMGCAASTGPLYRDEHDFATTAAYYDKDEDVKKDWVENEQLGEGMFARVVKVTRKSTNQQYACKVLRKTTVIEDNEIKLAPKASDLLREIDCLRRVGGAKGCLKLCGVVESPCSPVTRPPCDAIAATPLQDRITQQSY